MDRGATKDAPVKDLFHPDVIAANAAEGERLKQEGMDQAAVNKASLLQFARRVAVDLATTGDGTCDADMVQAELERLGVDQHALGNAAGRLFTHKDWVPTGEIIKSVRPWAHRNPIKRWRLKATS